MAIFQYSALKDAEDLFKRVEISEEQQEIISSLSAKLCEYIPMKIVSMMGLGLMVIKEWQIKYKKSATEIETVKPEDRINFMVEILEMLEEKIKRILKDSSYEEIIKAGIQATLVFYKENFAKR